MVVIRQRLNHNNRNYYGKNNKKIYITIHDTGNPSAGADAFAHARFIENGSSATWHYSVDDKEAIQHFSHNIQCWHAGDSRGNGNLNSIGIEMCINSDGNYLQTIENTIELVQKLMREENIEISFVVQHNHWSGKDCPRQMRNGRDGITWNTFKNLIQSTSTPPKEERDEQKLYKVQTGAYSKKENAEALAKKLKDDGYETYIVYEGTTPELNRQKSVQELYDEVMAGKHGNGEQRRQSLGNRYNEVQRYINSRH